MDRFTVDVVEEEVRLTLVELSRAVRTPEDVVRVWVVEGVLVPVDGDAVGAPDQWRFAGASLRRARLASTLTHALALNPPGVAFALDLMERIERLESQLRRGGAR